MAKRFGRGIRYGSVETKNGRGDGQVDGRGDFEVGLFPLDEACGAAGGLEEGCVVRIVVLLVGGELEVGGDELVGGEGLRGLDGPEGGAVRGGIDGHALADDLDGVGDGVGGDTAAKALGVFERLADELGGNAGAGGIVDDDVADVAGVDFLEGRSDGILAARAADNNLGELADAEHGLEATRGGKLIFAHGEDDAVDLLAFLEGEERPCNDRAGAEGKEAFVETGAHAGAFA